MASSSNLTQEDWHRIFEQQYDLFYRRLVYMAGYIIGDRQAAHDIVIDVLLKIRSRLMTGQTPLEELKPAYFKTAVNNACLDWLKNQRRVTVLDGGIYALPDELGEGTDRALLLQAIEMIEDLPPQQRQVMTLIYFEGKDVQGVAETMGIAASTVYQHRQAALKTLRDRQMKRKGIDPEVLLLMVLLFKICKHNHQ
jgi:RNA polymerase sigma-70 factor (ECF subfamily)